MARSGLVSLFLICWIWQTAFCQDVTRRLTNQERAEKIADLLRKADFKGQDITIEVNRGVVTLTGYVEDTVNQKLVSEVASRVEGVTQVNNLLTIGEASGHRKTGAEVAPDSNSDSQPGTVDPQFSGARRNSIESPFAESSLNSSFSIPISMESTARLAKKLLTRQQELFQSDTLRRIEVRANYQNKTTPLYDIYCGKHRLVIVSRVGGLNHASFEGTVLNSFQGGLYEWKSSETTGLQFVCEEQDLLNYFQYSLDPGGIITSLYLSFETQPELFDAPMKRKDGVRELVLQKPYYQMHSIAVTEDPLWFHELNHLDKDGNIVSRVYGKPTNVDAIPESVTAALKEVKFEPTKQTVYSLMRYP